MAAMHIKRFRSVQTLVQVLEEDKELMDRAEKQLESRFDGYIATMCTQLQTELAEEKRKYQSLGNPSDPAYTGAAWLSFARCRVSPLRCGVTCSSFPQ